MKDKINVNPAKEGIIVRFPITGKKLEMTEKGTSVPRCSFWLRRIKDGDVVIANTTAKKTTTTARKETDK